VVGYEGYAVTRYAENGEVRSPFTDGRSVVVLGDSTTKGAEVPDSQKYVNRTEEVLRERGVKADLHNLGLAERSIADSVYQAPAVIEAYAPEVVVVQANLNAFEISLEADRTNHFVFGADGNVQLVHRDVIPDATRHNIVASSGLLSFVAYRWQFVRASLVTGYPFLFPNEPPDDSVVISRQAEMLAMLNALREAYPNSKIVILVISQVPKVPLERAQPVSWSSHEDDLLVAGLRQLNWVTVVYPSPAFQQRFNQDRVLPRGFFNSPPNLGHLNEYGNEAVASVLADALEALLR
jgi:lysophospholipase L1-like esterase